MAISEETMSHYAETTYGRRSKDVDEARRIYQPKQSDITGKIIIFTLAGLCILLFIFIIIGFFFIAKPLKASLTYVDVRSLSYNKDTSSSLYFNSTLAMEIRIENPNLGFFEFPTSKGDVLYNGQVVGEMRISGQRVASFGSIRTEVRTEVGYKGNQRSPVWLKNDIERRLIILNTRAKLRGEVHLKALNKRTVSLNCLMHLNLKDEVIHRLWCN
ncbi:PREDICTED: late embryogenesis abundant protein At1g64065-like isoform X1 [Camelina sativa]|uniref:Late embryogenesis abundant protein At1g64065-like isoform X1 n=1 Tax=Camelina sativa TaxID=90675 RepID=A0ABM0YV31_CAMSA|nr:PREDICTED: late embryogenesis abundant protein At1g64065-like isoform X1 [Camelina sativa]